MLNLNSISNMYVCFFFFSGAPGVRGEPGKFHIKNQILTFLKVPNYCINFVIIYFMFRFIERCIISFN